MTDAASCFVALPEQTAARFWSKVALPDENGCMLWIAGLRRGYGQFSIDHRTNVLATRIIASWAHGPAPTTQHEAAHSCRNRNCVAPAHLRWATALENITDRGNDGTTTRGERHHRAKLTEAMALEILAIADERTHRQIAQEYGVSRSSVSNLLLGKTWKHLPRRRQDEPRQPRRKRKLTDGMVLEIRNSHGVSQEALAAKYGVSQATISNIRTGRRRQLIAQGAI